MKRIFMTVILMASFFFMAEAQQPAQQEHEKRVYKKDGNTYVQKSLPLYLNFSTSPGGENHRLESKATKEYTNPMYLDTEGINYIRSHWAVDPKTGKTIIPQKEILFELYADGLPPVTSIRFSGAPVYRSGGKVYYGKGLSVTLTSRDGVSGVEGTNYALNASSYSKYSSPLNLNTEKEHQLHYYAYDYVGNAEATKNRNFTVDLTPAVTSHSIVGINHSGNILAPSTRFTLSRTDNLSGVRSTYYHFDDKGDKLYTSNITMAGLKDGEHTLYYHSHDNVKNHEDDKTFSFYLDRIPPVPVYKIAGDQHKGNYTYVSPRTKINFTATDNKAGVKVITYNMDGSGNNTFSSDFSVTNTSGLHYIRYTSTDNVENTSARKTLTVFMDNTPPSTGIVYGKPQFFDRDTLFINKETDIKLIKSDAHSGLQKTEYAIDGGAFKSYSVFNIPAEGHHKITFKSTDNVNNVEQVKESSVFVDNTPPDIFINFSIKPIGQRNGKDVYPNYTRMYIGATDKHCGTEQIFYSINGSELNLYSSPYSLDVSEVSRFKSKKKYEVRVVTKDKLGNTSEKTVEFYVGKD